MGKPAPPNPIIDAIVGRRSVRDGYTDIAVPRYALDWITRCGVSGPSSKNAQPARLHVVTDRVTLSRIADLVAAADGASDFVPHDPRTGKPSPEWQSTVDESAAVVAAAPAAIFIENTGSFSGGRANLMAWGIDALRESIIGYTLEVMGVGAALQNMWTAANSLELDAVFMGDVLIAGDEISALLGMIGDLMGVLVVGYAEDPSGTRPNRSPDGRVVWH
jgi:nitroreductase